MRQAREGGHLVTRHRGSRILPYASSRVPGSPPEDNFEASRFLEARRVPSGSWRAPRLTFQLAIGH